MSRSSITSLIRVKTRRPRVWDDLASGGARRPSSSSAAISAIFFISPGRAEFTKKGTAITAASSNVKTVTFSRLYEIVFLVIILCLLCYLFLLSLVSRASLLILIRQQDCSEKDT